MLNIQLFSDRNITYVTKLKKNAVYDSLEEIDIPEFTDDGVIKDEVIVFLYGEKKSLKHKSRRIAYWDDTKRRLSIFLINNFELSEEEIIEIYKKRWSFTGIVSMVRLQLMSYISIYNLLEDTENTERTLF